VCAVEWIQHLFLYQRSHGNTDMAVLASRSSSREVPLVYQRCLWWRHGEE